MADYENLRCTLDAARACVYKAQPHQSLEHLRSVQSEIDDLEGTSAWAEHELIYACTLAAMNERSAETAFDDALKRISSLSVPDLALEMTACLDYAKYLAGRCATLRAKQHYKRAEEIAGRLDRNEEVAHIQMCVIRIGLEECKSSHLVAFRRLQEAAKDGYTELQQREAWIDYNEVFGGIEPHLVAARKGGEASVDYFRGALSRIRRDRK